MRCFSGAIVVGDGVNFCQVFAFSSICDNAQTGKTLNSC